MLAITNGRERPIIVAGFDAASLVMQRRAAVKDFLENNEISYLEPFVGAAISDISGRRHPLETRPNVLYRLASAGGEAFETVYRLVN